MVEQKSSGLFAAMNKNARLRKNMQKAKSVQASREFSGPDGDYSCIFKRFSTYDKDGVTNVIFEFRTTEEAGEFANEKLVIFIKFADGPIRTAEEEQALMFEMIQLMGIDTSQDDAAIEADLNALVLSETVLTLRSKTTTSKKNGNKYKNFSVVGVAAEGQKDPDYSSPIEEEPAADEEWPEEETEAPAEESSEEWPDEEPQEFKPSDAIGQTCIYKKKSCILVNANNESGKCIVEDPKTKKRLTGIDWDQLEWPDA